jgi:hypothetical protein
MEKMEEEISEIKSDVKVIRQNIDTLLSFSTDHEARLRVQEQSQCPFHEKVEDRLDKQDVNNAITSCCRIFFTLKEQKYQGIRYIPKHTHKNISP